MNRKFNNNRSKQNNKNITKTQVKGMIASSMQKDIERKYILNSLGTTTAMASVTSSGTVYALTAVAEGTGAQNRIGRNAVIKRIWGNLSFYADGTPTTGDIVNTGRLVIFRWTDLAAPTIGDVLQSSTNYVNSFYNIDYYRGPKLKILYDHKVGASYSGNGVKVIRFDLKGQWPVQWNTSSASSAVVGGIFAIFVSDSTTTSHPGSAGAICLELDQ